MSKFGKLVLMLTALAPILGAFAVNSFAHMDWMMGGLYLGGGVLLVIVCWLVLWRCRTILPEEPLTTKKVKTADKEVLAFLLVYLLPLFTKDLIFTGNWFTPVYILAIIGFCVYHGNSFTFNPLLAMAGYHFYEVENENGMTYLLISKKTIHRHDNTLQVKRLADYIYLEI
jgi:MFS family permease